MVHFQQQGEEVVIGDSYPILSVNKLELELELESVSWSVQPKSNTSSSPWA